MGTTYAESKLSVATQREDDSWGNSRGVREELGGSEDPAREMVSSKRVQRGTWDSLCSCVESELGPEVTFIPGRDPPGSYLRELHTIHTNQTFESHYEHQNQIFESHDDHSD